MKVNVQILAENHPGEVKLKFLVSFNGTLPLKGERIMMYVLSCHES